jgi:hypothetical protein
VAAVRQSEAAVCLQPEAVTPAVVVAEADTAARVGRTPSSAADPLSGYYPVHFRFFWWGGRPRPRRTPRSGFYFRFFSKKSVVFSSSCLRNSPVTPWLFCG